MAGIRVDATQTVSGPSPLDQKGRRGSRTALAVVLVGIALAVAPGAARAAAYVCFFPERPNDATPQNYAATKCATEVTWPTTWTPVGLQAESSTDAPTNPSLAEFDNVISMSGYPGFYVAKKGDYIFFRARVNWGSAVNSTNGAPYVAASAEGSNGTGTLFWLLTTTNPASDVAPKWAISWDNLRPIGTHGLEMNYQDSINPTKWTQLNFNDVDGSNSTRCEYDFDGPASGCATTVNASRREGYVRTYDQQTYNGAANSALFVEFAVACSYFTRAAAQTGMNSFNPCTTPFWSSAAMGYQDDNTDWTGGNAKIDVFGITTWSNATAITSSLSWGSSFDPTAVVVAGVRSRATPHGIEVHWKTASEVGTAGFNLYRKDPATGSPVQVNESLVPALPGSPNGARYAVLDPDAPLGTASIYVLEEIEFQGTSRSYGPFTVRPEHHDASPEPDLRVGHAFSRAARNDDPGTARLRAPRRSMAVTAKAPKLRLAGSAARVVVAQEGLQVVTSRDVALGLGIDEFAARTLIRDRKLRLTGAEGDVACQVSRAGDRLYFVGQPLDSTWANTSVYWLTRGECRPFGHARGTPPRSAPPPGATVFSGQSRAEQDLILTTSLFQRPDEDIWLWTYFVGGNPTRGTASYELRAPAATGGAGEVTVHLQGATTTNSGRDHHVRLTLNGTPLGETRWPGASPVSASFTVPPGTFQASGDNALLVETLLDAGLPHSVLALDSIEYSWERRARAEADRLLLPRGVSGDVLVEGFTGPDVWVVDVGNPARPVALSGVTMGSRNGSVFARFSPPPGAGPLLAIRPQAAYAPAVVPVPARPRLSTLAAQGADYLVITSPELASPAGRLATMRQAEGLRSLVVTTDRIYDEYSGGNLDPQAIRSFLGAVHRTWRIHPRFVVLVGTGTYDGRDVLGVGDNHVPPMLVTTPYGLASSDVALADVDGDDGVPEFAIGRIPASTEAELDAYLGKLDAYALASGPWVGRALFLADNGDNGGDFGVDSAASAARLGGTMGVLSANLAGDATATRGQVIGALGEGVGLFHYFGHAGVDRLASEGLFTSTDSDSLANADRTPLAMLMTCMAGNYGYPGYDSLGVRMTQNPAGGAIATWSSSSLEMQADSSVLSQGVLARLADGSRPTFGEAIRSALAASRDAGGPLATRLTYNLFGDPAVALRP